MAWLSCAAPSMRSSGVAYTSKSNLPLHSLYFVIEYLLVEAPIVCFTTVLLFQRNAGAGHQALSFFDCVLRLSTSLEKTESLVESGLRKAGFALYAFGKVSQTINW